MRSVCWLLEKEEELAVVSEILVHFQDGERQKEKQASKIVISELKMANEEFIKVERKDLERTQKQSWNTPFFTR